MPIYSKSFVPDIRDVFAPFLVSLATVGIRLTLRDYERISRVLRTGDRWDVERLRFTLIALLVRNPDQEMDFQRRFDQFFLPESEAEADLETIDVRRVLGELRWLSEGDVVRGEWKPVTVQPKTAEPIPEPRWQDDDEFALPPSAPEEQEKVDEETADSTQTASPPPSEPQPELPSPPVEDFSRFPFGFAVCNGEVVGETFELPDAEAPVWDETLPRLFRPSTIGGRPALRLDNETLDQLADSLGYFQSEQVGNTLDVPASIRATADRGGFPILAFERRKQVRSVLILEDTYTEALTWNPIIGELAQGLARRGVPVTHGRFQGVPDRFYDLENNRIVYLEDLEDQRRGYLLLIFSDGKGLHYQHDQFTLEALTHWPMVAWMELREPHAWDESSALVARVGIPVYSASCAGLLQVMRRFMTERGSLSTLLKDSATWRGLPAQESSIPLAVHVERLLGDALLWAQDCAMMLPPLSLGLADALRREFHPHLPPERVERLYALPGTTWNTSGLQFSQRVLAVLRRGFATRHTEAEQQEAVLKFLLQQIQRAEPEDEHSPAHIAWEWRRERVRLELEPDLAVQRLARFARSPLGEVIRAELKRLVFPDSQGTDPDAIPLRLKPRTQSGVEYLQKLAQHDDAALPEAWLGYSFQDRLHDGSRGPEMVVIPAGEFLMGSPESEEGRFNDERQHRVVIERPFAIGKYTVTFEEYDCFAKATGRNKPNDVGWGRGRRPVINVTWYDAVDYTEWLSEHTGRHYRLPTEAEWEYAARAGTRTAFHFGDTISTDQANYGRWRTVEVGQFAANAWGLYDTHGNVWEWMGSAYDPDYGGGELRYANKDNGSPCVLRGGSSENEPGKVRGAARIRSFLRNRGNVTGFRLARTLTP
jgi:formylglycine-generating enzyme required for sulfatase activity